MKNLKNYKQFNESVKVENDEVIDDTTNENNKEEVEVSLSKDKKKELLKNRLKVEDKLDIKN